MKYNYDIEAPLPDLQTFISNLVTETLVSVFFQQPMDLEIDMLRLPLIVAPAMTGKMVNSEAGKKTLMNKDFKYEEETLEKFQELIDSKEVNVKSIGDLTNKDLREIANKLGISHSSKTNEMLKIDLVNLSKIILGKNTSNIFVVFFVEQCGDYNIFCHT